MHQLLIQLSTTTYPCEIKPSHRARYLRIKLTHTGELSVVVPTGVDDTQVKAFVLSQTQWIERKLNGLSPIISKPKELCLLYVDETWLIDYAPDNHLAYITVKALDNYSLECSGAVENAALLKKALGKWLKQKAERIIPNRLAVLSELHGFHFNRVTIRGQKTRWGSCSSSKNISLNYKLLFLEPALVDYVLIHELCHTIEMNHSSKFWQLVADCDEDYKRHDKLLNQASRWIPL